MRLEQRAAVAFTLMSPLQRGATSVDDGQLYQGGGRIIGARLPG
jgi:hypothetical protein